MGARLIANIAYAELVDGRTSEERDEFDEWLLSPLEPARRRGEQRLLRDLFGVAP